MRLYDQLAGWWYLLSPPEEYAEEAAFYTRTLRALLGEGSATTPLELGSGGGNNASHMKESWQLTLVDRSERMLEGSRRLNPECRHLPGDMRSVRLDERFDAVFIHDAISYVTSFEDLERTIATAYCHTRPGGAVLLAPDDTRETYRPRTSSGGSDGPERALRYLEWAYDPDPRDDTTIVDFAFLLREADGSVRVEHERHLQGLLSERRWLEALAGAGFEGARCMPAEHSLGEDERYVVFVALRPNR